MSSMKRAASWDGGGARHACPAAAYTLKRAEMFWWVDGRRPRFILSTAAMACRAGHRGSSFFLAQPALGILVFCLLPLPLASPVLSLQSSVKRGAGGMGGTLGGLHVSVFRQETNSTFKGSHSKTSIEETLSIGAFRLRAPQWSQGPSISLLQSL